MKNTITITLQYPNQDPVIFFERAIRSENIAQAFSTARNFISKNVQAHGRKMPLVKMEAPAGIAPASMKIFHSPENSNAEIDVFLFGNLNVLQPERQHSSQFYTSNMPVIASTISRQDTLVRVPVGA